MTEMNGIARSDLERLSAFLDGELRRAEADQLEARMATDRQLKGALEALRATSELVGSLPEIHPPRSFALTPEMVRPRRAYPILQFSTAMAALGFVLVIGLICWWAMPRAVHRRRRCSRFSPRTN